MDKNNFIWESEVRDYELDSQGRVNNSVYFNYFEHARHCHFKDLGFGFTELHNKGFDYVMIRCEIEYKESLVSGD